LLNIESDPWQCDLLTSSHKRIILNCSRQSGKSTIVAILALHHGILNPRALVAVVSYSQLQSTELLRKVSYYYKQLGQPDGIVADSATALELRNGSRIIALPGSEPSVRGFTASLVLIDEAAQVSEEIYRSIRPSLAVSGGRLILLSTPRGKKGIFWRAWNQESDWKKVKVTADQCPRITMEFLDEERRALGPWFAQEYLGEFIQEEGSIFKEGWVQHFDSASLPDMDTIIQSWDTAQTKSASSDYVVGQVWGRVGADFYLLDQVRGRWDFDQTVQAIQAMASKWPQSCAKIIEAQPLGAALCSHLKHKIPGMIPIHVKDSKQQRALNCVPVWQSKNVYLPKPDDGEYSWVREYMQELTNFPNGDNDDQVDATTLALNQLQGPLFPEARECVVENMDSQPLPGHSYFIGWIPARPPNEFTVLVFDLLDYKVVDFERYPVEPTENQISRVRGLSRTYNGAVVRAFDDLDEAMLFPLEMEGVLVERVKLTGKKFVAAYENLARLIRRRKITFPPHPKLLAEVDVFKSASTYDERPDYRSQSAGQSAIHAMCLVTHDLMPEVVDYVRRPSVYYSYDWRFVKGGFFG
jgi:predicted phage terminase large subunit-like protein